MTIISRPIFFLGYIMKEFTALLVGHSLYIGIDMRTHNLDHFRDMIMIEIEEYKNLDQVSYLFSYISDGVITSKADVLYHIVTRRKYNDVLDNIMDVIDRDDYNCDKLCYLLLKFKLPEIYGKYDVEWYVFEPEGDVSKDFKIVVGDNLLSYIDYRKHDGFDNMDVSYIKLRRDMILHEKITYKPNYSKDEYTDMVKNGYYRFLNRYNKVPELMLIRLSH